MTVTETEGATVMETVTEATVEDVMVTGIEDLTDAGHLVSIRHTLLKTFLKLFSSTFKDYLDAIVSTSPGVFWNIFKTTSISRKEIN